MEFNFDYSIEDDILSIFNYKFKSSESIEFSDNLILDIDKKGFLVGIEILDASDFLNSFQGMNNKKLMKEILSNLKSVELIERNYRGYWCIILLLKSKEGEIIQQTMPLLKKSEYKSPLLLAS